MSKIKDNFISSIFAQFRNDNVLDAWGMFAQAYYVVYLVTYLDTSVAYHKYIGNFDVR